jgi:hypothetical protein
MLPKRRVFQVNIVALLVAAALIVSAAWIPAWSTSQWFARFFVTDLVVVAVTTAILVVDRLAGIE